MNEEIEALEAAVKLIRLKLENDEKLSEDQLFRIGSCAGTLRTYMGNWKKRNQDISN